MRTLTFDRALGALVLVLAASFAHADAPLRTIGVKIGTHALKVEVVDTDETRSKGLMFRKTMPANDGMLFVFEDVGYHSMWMKNTYLPLSVAFIDGEGKILNILDMEPLMEITYTAAGPARYAIETNKGWFAGKKIEAGAKVTGLPLVKPGR
ncbi:DUF192 domain-containing protein [Usitatibacter palustris]|uniref:DUF192 domain-containing protein n=1 Tax=Usitatibacter palustris TaxID=2732487 RepID=A0A6M4H5S4_9PROT|nr:DUF192 domain-containing protein [Usitatibacter palustris]QJR14003.1 hypothetical protein DSM104440_00795 [Usitatibacter palustris]